MILISHRGNVNGRLPQYENGQTYCQETIDKGYHVEIDVYWYDGIFWTGHDRPQYRVDIDFLQKEEVWCHAKDIEALFQLQKIDTHCFFHQNDNVTLTSKGYLWTLPTHILTENSICVLPELQKIDINNCAGICSDFVENFK